MKKRIFIQNSIFWQLTCLLLLVAFCVAAFNFVAFIVAFVGMSLAGVNEYPLYMWIFTEILWLIGTIMCPYEFINMESYTIFLDGNRVWMNGEIRPKEFKTQYKASVQMNEIREVSFVRTNRNSRNKSIKRPPQAYAIKRYLVFKKANGKEVWMNVSHYTDDYLAKILAELILRITNSSNVYNGETVQDIMSKDFKI